MFLLSFVHGFIVTEVFQSVSDSKILSSWAGLSNQAGALSGSVITFIIVQMGLFKKVKLPVSENLAKNGIYLPTGIALTLSQQKFVINKIKKIFLKK